MKKCCLFLFTISCFFKAHAQIQTDSFYLHKFAQNIGREIYLLTVSPTQLSYDIDFKFTDRGQAVPLKAELNVSKSYEPIRLFIKGSTSRFSTINDSIRFEGKSVHVRVDDSIRTEPAKPLQFPVAGYSPGTVQAVLLQYWKKHGEPKLVPTWPAGSVTISRQGKDQINFGGKQLTLDRFVIGGLIWGNEILWTDNNGRLICLITNDAEGDKLEMMDAAHESLLPDFISLAATYGMQLFNSSMKLDVSNARTLAIVGGNVVDVDNGIMMNNQTIIVQDGLIKEFGASSAIKVPGGATVIHAEGKTVLPGLWDMHSHFEQAEWGPAYLAAGVTTVRDCGNEFAYINSIKSAIDSHKGVGPTILKAGIIDGPGNKALGIVRASTAEEAARIVDMYKANGFIQIKIYSSIRPPVVKAICDEAHKIGLTVTGHIPTGMTIQQGVDSGMDMVNHIQYVYSALRKNKDQSINMNDSSNLALLEHLKERHTVIDPTIGVFEMSLRSTSDDILEMEPAFFSLPLPLQALFRNTGMPDGQARAYKPVLTSMKRLVKILFDKGIPIVAGTDMGFPGLSVHRELELYVEGGLTPMQAIQTATIIPARVMKMDVHTGSIRPGKQADLVIVNGEPLKNIRDIRKVSLVIHEGRQYDPALLHKMVGFGKM